MRQDSLVPELYAMRRLIERGWVRLFNAADAEGRMCGFKDPQATAWSLQGALNLRRSMGFDTAGVRRALIDTLGERLSPWEMRSKRTKEDVLDLIDRTISRHWSV